MNELFFLSRSFVEFGPFPAAELVSFHERGLLKDTDYVRAEASEEWVHIYEWAAPSSAPVPVIPSEPAPVTSVVAPKEKKAAAKPKAEVAKKAAPAKKTAKKSA